MKREIKFRAWDKEQKEMIFEGVEYQLRLVGYLPGNEFKESNIIGFTELDNMRFDLMQFTGLHDKNGKEIYEGDIVNMVYDEPYNRPHIVIWHLNKFIAIHLSQYKKGNDFVDGKLPNSYNAKVIGNIYENPELLKTN